MNKSELKQWFFEEEPNMAVFWAEVSDSLLGNSDFKDFLRDNNITSQIDYMRKIRSSEVPAQTAIGFLQDVADLYDIDDNTVLQDFDGGCLAMAQTLYRRRYVWFDNSWYTSCEHHGVMSAQEACERGGHHYLNIMSFVKHFWRLRGV